MCRRSNQAWTSGTTTQGGAMKQSPLGSMLFYILDLQRKGLTLDKCCIIFVFSMTFGLRFHFFFCVFSFFFVFSYKCASMYTFPRHIISGRLCERCENGKSMSWNDVKISSSYDLIGFEIRLTCRYRLQCLLSSQVIDLQGKKMVFQVQFSYPADG